MISSLIAYDASGIVIATLDYVLARDPNTDDVIGLIDFAAHEEAGGEHVDVWSVDGATGSKVWPEWLGGRAHDFKVELVGLPGAKRIAALVHKTSGYRRDRAVLEAAIAARIAAAGDAPADIRDLVGGPDRPLVLDDTGRTKPRLKIQSNHLPVVARV